MAGPIKLSSELIAKAKIQASVSMRSIPKQIEHWARIGRIAEENPDLPYDFIKGILVGMEEFAAGNFVEYTFETRKPRQVKQKRADFKQTKTKK